MNDPRPNSLASGVASRRSKRRPSGVSRRKKREFGFETLEDRRVMSAQPLAALGGNAAPAWEVTGFSSNTYEGQLEILRRELARYADQANAPPVRLVPTSIPTDPFLGDQWGLINSGQQVGNPDFQSIFGIPGEDINVAPVWNQGIFGTGVVVAVVDTGVQWLHPDLADNIDPALQLDALDLDGDANPPIFLFDPDDFNPAFDPGDAHGTAVAGIIGAVANNGLGGSGVAPGVQLVPIRFLGTGFNLFNAAVDTFRYEIDQIDITNNSWGPAVDRGLAGPTPSEFNALRDSIQFGRDGLGVIHVFAAGNSGELSDTSNYNGWVNSRYTIGVTGVDHDGFYNNIDGTVTGYPEIGTSVLVAAPTGSNPLGIVDDTGALEFPFAPGFIGSGIVTTDITGESGFNVSPDPVTGQEFDSDYEPNEDFTSRFNGTSAATPFVSGVIALMLEANPNLSWRDVQEILVRSARQNQRLAEPANGADKAFNQSFPNTWIVNQMPLYHDPDPWDATINPAFQTYTPTLDPNLTYAPSPTGGFFGDFSLQNHYAPTPAKITNGAGYTVSHGFGTNGEWVGSAHGVIDAELAVQLAQQWHTKNQVLPEELTWTTAVNTFDTGFIPRAVNTGEDRGDFVVPGGLGGETGFIDYYQEYFDPDDPFAPDELPGLLDNQRSAGPIELTVPDDNAMSVEHIELSFTVDVPAEALDHLRIVIVSPNGTHSELNHFAPAAEFTDDIVQIIDFGNSPGNLLPLVFSDSLGSVDTGVNTFTFSSNRNWGERSDSAIIFNPLTMEPMVDSLIGFDSTFNPGEDFALGDAIQQGWQIHFENWGDTDLNVTGIEIAWHGSPINPNTRRVQGLVGVDDNRDDLFNYSRIITDTIQIDNDPAINRLGEIFNIIDPDQESMGANVTVTATRVSDGVVVDQFVTGADGNYYFDLIPDNYIISVEDGAGRTALDDSLTPNGLLENYRSEWLITEDFFQVWDYDANLNVPIDPATGAPIPWLDGNGAAAEYGMQHINFLIDPGPVATNQVQFTGVVFADTDGDGAFNSDDIAMPDIAVFGDLNRNARFDAGEPLVETALDGSYTLTVDTTVGRIVDIGVIAPLGWGVSSPDGDLHTFFGQPGDAIGGVDFAIQPAASAGNSGNGPGIILGTVFDDANGNAVRNAGELGVSGVTVYLDTNFTGVLDAGDRTTTTNVNGSYVFTDVAAGSYDVRMDIASPNVQTLPFLGAANTVIVRGNGTAYPINFGVQNTAILDFGDLPQIYGVTTLAENGARHNKGNWFLGARIDAELDGQPSANADGDDAVMGDEDGIVIEQLPPGGGTVTLTATASFHGGYLKGWMDFNNNGSFDDPGERLIFSEPGQPGDIPTNNKLLDVGPNTLTFEVPALNTPTVFARFRYGEFEINSITGFAQIGEVEDYELPVAAPVIIQTGEPGDFNDDGAVSGSDFLAWQRGFGTSSGAARIEGDSNADGDVDGHDLSAWEAGFHSDSITVVAPVTADFNLDGDVDGANFLAWQRGVGNVNPGLSDGDGDRDGDVDGADLALWENTFGTGVGANDGSAGSQISAAAAAGIPQFVAPQLAVAVETAEATASRGPRTAFLANADAAERSRAVDAAFESAAVDLPLADGRASFGLLRRDRVLDDDLFTVSRDRAFAAQQDDADHRNEVFAQLPKAFVWR